MTTFDYIFSYSWWQLEVFGNTIWDYAQALGIFILLLVALKLFQVIVLHRLKVLAERTQTDIDDVLIRIIKTVKPPFYSFVAFYLVLKLLLVTDFTRKVIDIVLIVWITFLAIGVVQILIGYAVRRKAGKEDEKGARAIAELLGNISKGILWILGGLFILSNLGVNITSLIAGLGIGGIAIALALQNILGDLFSSFAIYFDKPFGVGDFIEAGGNSGTVEKIGVKSTRLRSLQGEEIVISNKELTSTRIKNYKRMKRRRAVFTFGVVYQTPAAVIKRIPKLVKEIIEALDKASFDRCHFTKFDDSALTFETVYFIESSNYGKYRDINQKILVKIKEAFEKESIEMAYPTQTVYVNRSESANK